MEISSVLRTAPVTENPGLRPVRLDAEDRELIRAVKKVNEAARLGADHLLGADNELTFTFDRESRRPVIRIVDRESREVIRQIPAEHVLRLAGSCD